MERTETRWGHYDVLHEGKDSLGQDIKLKELYIAPNKNISYQRHEKRNEVWMIMGGSGEFVWEGNKFDVESGIMVSVPVGYLHTVKAGKDGLKVLEFQYGEACVEEDIERICEGWDGVLARVENNG